MYTSTYINKDKKSKPAFQNPDDLVSNYTTLYGAINNYLDKGGLWLWQWQIFHKRQTTVTMN
jgi:hypothetical protein